MAVKIGSARIDERGKISGGAAGDQTGKEVSTQNWYKHSKGWRVLRCVDVEMRRHIAEAMEEACKSSNIGYDQNQRNTLYNAISGVGFDIKKLIKKVETDCSALVRVCVSYAIAKVGKNITVANFVTSDEASVLKKTGLFKEMTGSKYTSQPDYLCVGDILVTKTKGHTVVVLDNGPKAEDETPEREYSLGDRTLKNGMEGADVKELQNYLIQLGYSCGRWGADGDFGDSTELAVSRFQSDHACNDDGVYGPITHQALKTALEHDEVDDGSKYVKIVNGDCWIRSASNTSGDKIAVAPEGNKYEYLETSENGWLKIVYKNQNGWVSGKYGKIVEG